MPDGRGLAPGGPCPDERGDRTSHPPGAGARAPGLPAARPKKCFERQGVAILRLVAPGNAGEALTTAEAFGGRRAVEGGFMAPNDFFGRAARPAGFANRLSGQGTRLARGAPRRRPLAVLPHRNLGGTPLAGNSIPNHGRGPRAGSPPPRSPRVGVRAPASEAYGRRGMGPAAPRPAAPSARSNPSPETVRVGRAGSASPGNAPGTDPERLSVSAHRRSKGRPSAPSLVRAPSPAGAARDRVPRADAPGPSPQHT